MPSRSAIDAGRRVSELAGRSECILTIAELRECGLSKEMVRTRMRHGTLHRIHEGVYAVGHANLTPLARCVAAVKACGPRSLLGFSSALAALSLGTWTSGLPPEVILVGDSVRSHRGIRVHRTKTMPPQDVTKLGCIRMTSAARTIADMAGRLDDSAVLQLVRTAQGKKAVTHRQLLATHERLGRRPGSGRFLRAIANGPEPIRSELEAVVLDLIIDGGFARPDVDVPLWIRGRRVVPDFRWPSVQLIVEADGRAWHSGQAAEVADRERQALLESAGETVLRVTWPEAISHPGAVHARFARAGAPLASSASSQVG